MKLYNLSIEIEIPVFAEGRASAWRMAGRITRDMIRIPGDEGILVGASPALTALVQASFDASHALARVNQRIAAFEQRYGLASDAMRRDVISGDLSETEDICTWLMLMNRRERLAALEAAGVRARDIEIPDLPLPDFDAIDARSILDGEE